MPILNSILTWVMKKRIHDIELFIKYPHDVQQELFTDLIQKAKDTEWGRKYGYADIDSFEVYKEHVPLSTYEDIFPYIDRLMKGEQNLLWPSKVTWFAKSSGTTNARSKFVPVTREALEGCHFKGGKDLLAIYINNKPDTRIFSGKWLSVGGSWQVNEYNADSFYGDVSAVIMQNLPFWVQLIRTPKLSTALMDRWEDKIEKMASETILEDVTSIAGVPTWVLVLLRRVLEKAHKSSLIEVWPNLELFAHGAVAFGPYREIFKSLIPSGHMSYMEIYNATEGFFGIQDVSGAEDEMLLMLDYGIFYEFIPLEELHREQSKTLNLSEVELGKNYALVISTNSGLWRYMIGDTVRFTSLSPYRIKISGRTKHFINAFGEEVVVENAEAAVTEACWLTDAEILDFTAAPAFFEEAGSGRHEWIIEFKKSPADIYHFTNILDESLRKINSDYDAKRSHDMVLRLPIVHVVPEGTFHDWLRRKGKLGGQHKVPRLSNTREYVEEIMVTVS